MNRLVCLAVSFILLDALSISRTVNRSHYVVMSVETSNLFGTSLHRVTMDQAIALLLEWMSEPLPCRYVVTPNVDHIVKLQSDSAMREAYEGASLVIADGWPLVTASRWLGKSLPERVAGSDLVPELFSVGPKISGFRVFLLGAAPGVGTRAAEQIRASWPGVNICGVASPRFGFDTDPAESQAVIDVINVAAPHLLVVGLGAPRQEIWLHKYAERLNARVAVAAGATIDFLAGVQTRAPRWVRAVRMEWLFRLLTDPRRLAGRYAQDLVVFPQLVAAEWWATRGNRS